MFFADFLISLKIRLRNLRNCDSQSKTCHVSCQSQAIIYGTQTFHAIVSSHHYLVRRFELKPYFCMTFRTQHAQTIFQKVVSHPFHKCSVQHRPRYCVNYALRGQLSLVFYRVVRQMSPPISCLC